VRAAIHIPPTPFSGMFVTHPPRLHQPSRVLHGYASYSCVFMHFSRAAFRGDYDTFERTRMERVRHHEKQQERSEVKRAHMQVGACSFLTNNNKQA
jgi:hypothetical protein